MTGPLLAGAAGLGFGVFQTLNRRAVAGLPDAYLATFLQLLVALVVLVGASLATEDLGDLRTATTAALAWFAAAGVVHFALGWTLLNMSQMRVGAALTSPLLSTNPVFGALIAAIALRELPGLVTWAGIVIVTIGALIVSLPRAAEVGWAGHWRDSVWGLGASFAWAISPICTKKGLEGLSSPLLGVTLGMAVAVAVYSLALPLRPDAEGAIAWDALSFKLLAGIFVALSTWLRWLSLDYSPVGVVLALGLLSVPVVLVLSPLLMGRHVEQVGKEIWIGATLVVGGSLLLVVA
ncbi:MAG TPA: DMT family transporter [Gaiellaceae bacterium]|nr:DMT family transporter [Gaiellaceae bacterium]